MKSLPFPPAWHLFFILALPLSGNTQFVDCNDIELTISVTPANAVLSCNVTSVILQATGSSSNGSYAISWEGQLGQSNITVTEAGTYTAIITDTGTGCTATASSTVGYFNNPLTVSTGPDQTVTCITPCTQLEALVENGTGVISIEWNGPYNFQSNQLTPQVCTPGEYILSVHEEIGGCTHFDTVIVQQAYAYISKDTTATLCPGGCLEFGGETFCESGNYQLVFNSWQGCDSVLNLLIEPMNIQALLAIPDTLTCHQQQLQLDASNSSWPDPDPILHWYTPNGHFVETPASLTPFIDEPGTYIFTIQTSDNCTSSDTIEVVADRIHPNAAASEDTQLDCPNHRAHISANIDSTLMNYTILWNGPDSFISTLPENEVDTEGLYSLKVTNEINGCNTNDEVIVAPPEDVTLEWTSETTCWNQEKGAIRINAIQGGTAPYQYSLNGTDWRTDTVFQQLTSGNYTLFWKDQYECGSQADILVPETPPIETQLQNTYHICGDEYISLNAAANLLELQTPVGYLWNDGSTNPVVRTKSRRGILGKDHQPLRVSPQRNRSDQRHRAHRRKSICSQRLLAQQRPNQRPLPGLPFP